MPTIRKPPPFWTQLVDLILIELTNWRWSWRSLIILSTVSPLASMAALGISLVVHPLLIVLIPLCALPVSGIGALIGLKARNYAEAGSFNLLLTFALLALGPVIIPPGRLPDFLLLLGRFSPTTYASSALRQVLLGPITGQLAWDMAALVWFTAVSFITVGRLLQWRRD